MKILRIIVFLTFFYSCKNTNSTETPKDPSTEVETLVESKNEKQELQWFYSTVDKLRLREKPGTDAAVVEQIKEGAVLFFLNEETDFKEKIKLRNQWHEASWLKVKSESDREGWVFGGAVTKNPPKIDYTKMPYDACEADFVRDRNVQAYIKCQKEVAKNQLTKDARYIKKTSNGYQVTLLSGETKNLVNDNSLESESAFREYEYRFYLDKMGFFVFKIHRFEGGDYILMNDKFGYATPIYGMPKLSPDLNKIIVTNADVDAGFEYNGIQLFEMSDKGIETLFEEEFEHFAPHNPIWIDEKNIEFDFLSPESAPQKSRVKAKLSKNDAGNWKLTINNRRE